MSACLVCLEETSAAHGYHPRCVKQLFGVSKPPQLDIDLAHLHMAAQAMAGHTSLSGIQKKLSVSLSGDRRTLRVEATGGRYILKPQTGSYPALPENEHVTTLLAKLSGIPVATSGLVHLKDESLAFVARRFDRLPSGRKVRQEDFCQLAEAPPRDKYRSSAERCAKIVRAYATETLIQLQELYRQFVFIWWSGNGDMHLKNFSLLTDEEGLTKLTPAYDLLCTELVLPWNGMAFPLNGKSNNLARKDWRAFAEACGLPATRARAILSAQAAALPQAQRLIEASYLPDEQKNDYLAWIEARSRDLVDE
jgi:serine/threonine-protein kinase HipA